MSEPITEKWLGESGFKWSQEERQPNKHWRLWLGWGNSTDHNNSIDDIGIEVTASGWLNRHGEEINGGKWLCWIISHSGMRKIIHVRNITNKDELIKLVEALTGEKWDVENHMYGNCYSPDQAKRIRKQ